jgi:hypothetical protein
LPSRFRQSWTTFLVRDAEEPASEFFIVAQAADMPGGGDERFLHDVEARLLVADQFKNINVKRQLVAAKENVPSLRFPARACCTGNCSRSATASIYTQWNARGEKRFN